MKLTRKNYYLVNGRLDLSTLNEVYKTEYVQKEELESLHRQPQKVKINGAGRNYINPSIIDQEPKLYTDESINDILKEMGEYFSGIN